MAQEKTLLEQISDKEEELKVKTDLVCSQAEEIVASARNDAAQIISSAKKEGKIKAEGIYTQGLQEITTEINQIKKEGRRKSDEIRSQGERNLDRAALKICELITG
jgi:vacuolar-type H+-ATPase subunit H